MPENITEYRYVPLEYRAKEDRQDGDPLGTITGVVMSYGDVATLPWGTEEFAAGAFGDLTKAELWANRMHQRTQPIATNLETSLRYVDTKDALKTEIDLPPTTSGRDVEMEVKLGLLRGLSIEFQTIADELNYETGHRKVTQAPAVRLGRGGPARLPALEGQPLGRVPGICRAAGILRR